MPKIKTAVGSSKPKSKSPSQTQKTNSTATSSSRFSKKGLISGNNIYAVERLLAKRTTNGEKIEYLVKWKGWSNRYNQWEPEENIISAKLIEDFNKRQQQIQANNKPGTSGTSNKRKNPPQSAPTSLSLSVPVAARRRYSSPPSLNNVSPRKRPRKQNLKSFSTLYSSSSVQNNGNDESNHTGLRNRKATLRK